MSKMEWERLLSRKRLRFKGKEKASGRSPFQRDFDRIAFSSAFRRLQDKTQVHPLSESDYIRTRLTHSLEASCVGRSLGEIVGNKILEKHPELKDKCSYSDFGAIVAAATLAHDIGNPPLGHSGENAVRYWFKNTDNGKSIIKKLEKAQCEDLKQFEGNAQGFRVLTRLQRPANDGGLELTCATLAAFMKYPRLSYVNNGKLLGDSFKKHGFFVKELDLFREVAEEVGLINVVSGEVWCRHPLAFLVEAADDICYRIVDFEDGVRLNYVKYETAKKMLLEILSLTEQNEVKKELKVIGKTRQIDVRKEQLECLRSRAINALIQQVAECFMKNEDKILSGNLDESLMKLIRASDVVEKIYKKSRKDIYTAKGVLEIEAAGFEVIPGLLEIFIGAVNDKATGNPSSKSSKILELIPKQFLKSEGEVDNDLYTRVIKITDHLSGMTDSFAVATFKKIKGISLPHA